MKRTSVQSVFDVRALAKLRVVRTYLTLILLKVSGVGVLVFFLLAFLAPNLVDMRNDWALAGAVACFALALAALFWFAFQLFIDLRRFRTAWLQISRSLRLE